MVDKETKARHRHERFTKHVQKAARGTAPLDAQPPREGWKTEEELKKAYTDSSNALAKLRSKVEDAGVDY